MAVYFILLRLLMPFLKIELAMLFFYNGLVAVLQIHGYQHGVVSIMVKEFFMAALFDNFAVRHNNDMVGAPDC